jgi:hypothetical protein
MTFLQQRPPQNCSVGSSNTITITPLQIETAKQSLPNKHATCLVMHKKHKHTQLPAVSLGALYF